MKIETAPLHYEPWWLDYRIGCRVCNTVVKLEKDDHKLPNVRLLYEQDGYYEGYVTGVSLCCERCGTINTFRCKYTKIKDTEKI